MMDGEKLKQIRMKLSDNQLVFSGKLGITQSYYSALERGEKEVTAKLLNKLFKNIGVSNEWWYSSNGDIFSADLSGKNVGVLSGDNVNELQYLLKKASDRVHNELQKENPTLHNLLMDADRLFTFKYFLNTLIKQYLNPLFPRSEVPEIFFVDGEFSYSKYKEHQLVILKQIEHLEPAIHNLSRAIEMFYRDFEEFDNKKILKDHFSGSPGSE